MSGVFLEHPLLYFFETESLTEARTHQLAISVGRRALGSLLCPPSQCIQECATVSGTLKLWLLRIQAQVLWFTCQALTDQAIS